jgi:gliding motility-associated-like protein
LIRKLLLFPLLLLAVVYTGYAQVPVASISTTPASPISGCAPLAVSFNGSGTGAGLTYSWTFPGGSPATSTSQNQVVVYNTPGPWTASLVVSNVNGSSTPAKVLVTVNPVPTASFTEDKNSGCYPTWINFTNTTVPNVGQGESIASYLWNFGDGYQSTVKSPSHRYLTGGPIQVVLYVNNNFGCTGKSQVSMGQINLTGGIFPNFFSNLASTCNLPVTDSFVNTSITSGLPNISWNWDFGDGGGFNNNLKSPTHPYSAAATYTVRLAVTSSAGCSDTAIHQVNITANGNLTDFTYPDTVCVNSNVTFKNISSPHPVSSMWDYGSGPVGPSQDGSFTYLAPGTYSITLTNNFGACNGSITHTIVVVNAPTASFTGANLAGCKAPLTSTFTNTSTGATSWSWNFGDGTTSTLQNPPPHVYNALGTYPVTLMTNSAPGCSATSTAVSVTIQQPTVTLNNPLSFFGCAPYVFTPSATVLAVDGVASYAWSFGNGNTSTAANPPPQTYPAGKWPISLTIITNGGCTATTAPDTVYVGNSKPTPVNFSFIPPSACVASNIQFTAASPSTADKWYWDYGDGNTDNTNNPNPIYAYVKPGTYNVQLTEYNQGCWDTISHVIVVNPPLANFKISPVCGSTNSFTFTDASLGPVTTYLWNFGDFTTSSSPGPVTHTFPVGPPKTYNVTLTATTGTCSNTSPAQTVTANQGTVITISPNPVCVNSVVIFTAAAQGNIVNYQFEFGDGNSNIGGNVSTSYVYTKPGTYIVKVVTFDINGCVDSSGVDTIVVRGPIANFTPPPALSCTALTVNFKDLSTALPAGNKIVGWAWNFGDGGFSSAQDTSYTYTVPGTFTPSLTVTDMFGCTGTLVSPQTLAVSLPSASFTVSDDTTCPNAPIPLQFTNTSTGGFNPVYTWKFGDGNMSNTYQPPPYAYTNVGTYPVTLSITDAYGCTSNSPVTQIIVDTPHAAFIMSRSFSACPPLNDTFRFTGINALTYAWDFGNGDGSSSENPFNLYVNPGDYYPNLTITGHGGCASVETQHVHLDGPIGVLSYSPLAGCDTLTVNFNVASSNVVSYTWNFDESGSIQITNNSPNMTFVYDVPGQHYPFVTLEDSAGCKVIQLGQTPINIDSIGNTVFTVDKTILCDSGTVNFTNTSALGPSTTITSYSWNFGDGSPTQTGMFPTIAHNYTAVGNYSAVMSITTLGGCTGMYNMSITVAASPKVAVNGLVNQCEPAVLTFSGSELVPDPNGPLTWSWSFGNGQSATGQFPPSVSYPKAGEYIVSLTATNTAGCSTMTDTTTPNHLFIYPIPTVNAGADVTICDTSTLQLNATGTATTYNWLPPVIGNLSCLACPNPLATSPASTYFIVQGTTLFGCKAQDTINVTVNTQVTVNATGTDSVCLGQSASLNATGAAIYNWAPAEGLNNPNIANPVATPDASQIGNAPSAVITYTVTGYDDLKCYSDTKSINITAFNYPAITLTPNATINVGSSYQISSAVTTNIVSLNWTPSNTLSCSDCLTPLATPTKTTKYDLTAVNDGGCTTTDSIRVQVICNGANFFVPNSFSPNGDGINDRFIVNGVGLNVIPSITIYNRWGQIVFQKSNFAPNTPADAWDGTFNGQPAPSDVYVYTIQILCNNATLIPYHGNVTLIR